MILQKVRPSVEIKVRDHKYLAKRDILLETVSVVEEGKEGWAYTSKADLVIYVWKTSSGDNLEDGYIILLQELKDWLRRNEHRFEKKIAASVKDGMVWHTINVAVPIEAFPKGTLFHFDPHLTTNEQQQFEGGIPSDPIEGDLSSIRNKRRLKKLVDFF